MHLRLLDTLQIEHPSLLHIVASGTKTYDAFQAVSLTAQFANQVPLSTYEAASAARLTWPITKWHRGSRHRHCILRDDCAKLTEKAIASLSTGQPFLYRFNHIKLGKR